VFIANRMHRSESSKDKFTDYLNSHSVSFADRLEWKCYICREGLKCRKKHQNNMEYHSISFLVNIFVFLIGFDKQIMNVGYVFIVSYSYKRLFVFSTKSPYHLFIPYLPFILFPQNIIRRSFTRQNFFFRLK